MSFETYREERVRFCRLCACEIYGGEDDLCDWCREHNEPEEEDYEWT